MLGVDGLRKRVDLTGAHPKATLYVAVLEGALVLPQSPCASETKSLALGPLPRISIPNQKTERNQQASDNTGFHLRRAAALRIAGTARLRAGHQHIRCDGTRVAALWSAALGVGRDRVAGFLSGMRKGKWAALIGISGAFLGGAVAVSPAGGAEAWWRCCSCGNEGVPCRGTPGLERKGRRAFSERLRFARYLSG